MQSWQSDFARSKPIPICLTHETFSFTDIFPQTAQLRKRLWICSRKQENSQDIYAIVSSYVEWVVRDFIEDREDRPTIYWGLPLRTEFRAFVDFDTNEVLGVRNYWDSAIMRPHLRKGADQGDPHAVHDYVTYAKAWPSLESDFSMYKEKLQEKLQALLPNIPLSGPWSLDILKNGEDFYLIDMAQAQSSALAGEIAHRPLKENWMPAYMPGRLKRGEGKGIRAKRIPSHRACLCYYFVSIYRDN